MSYFKRAKGARQGDPISAYPLFFLLEIFFIMTKSNQNIQPTHKYLIMIFFAPLMKMTLYFLSKTKIL